MNKFGGRVYKKTIGQSWASGGKQPERAKNLNQQVRILLLGNQIQLLIIELWMFVVNFDFTDHLLPLKLLAINVPVVVAEVLTYPLQRIQTLLVTNPHLLTGSQAREIQLLFRNMLSIQRFPKMLHGMRYSVDYMATQMTTKFLVFDFLLDKTTGPISQKQKWKIITSCFIANLLSTAVSQIAYNYQTIASSLPIDKANRPENVKIMLEKYTKTNRLPIDGIKYTLPASLINTTMELFILGQAANLISRARSGVSYIYTDLLTAFTIFSTTAFVSHYAFQRQVEICKQLPPRSIPYTRGFLASFFRYNAKGLALYALYLLYFETKVKWEIQSIYEKRVPNERPQPYRL